MKLLSAHVTNFRSVNDSGEIEIGQRTCLVGKNEAGKTAVLQAIHGIKPLSKFDYVIERDYPRSHLHDYQQQHPTTPARVVITTWELDDNDVSLIEDLLGAGVVDSKTITISRSYANDTRSWVIDLDYQKNIDHLITSMDFDATEADQVGQQDTVLAVAKVIEALEEPTERQHELLKKIDTYRQRSPLLAAIDILDLPYFMYFSHYDRMSGQISIEKLDADIQAKVTSEGDSIFLDFLELAGTNIEELKSATTFESLNSKCEAVSNKITDQISEYWSQNDSLRIDVTVGRGESGDPAPFNSGTVVRARVYNDLHRVSVPFSERSAGFIWFFSFLVKFAQVKKKYGNMVILLDEPGLTLHGKAQADLLRYFDEQLEPQHQLIFSTHSPFLVPANDLSCVRIVEDVIKIERGKKRSEGTKVSSDALATDRDTLLPLQGALGYELAQSLFADPNTIIVEGPSEMLYIQAFSNRLRIQKRTCLNLKWILAPAGKIGNIIPLVSLFTDNNIKVAVLTAVAADNKNPLQQLQDAGILEANRICRITDFTGGDEGDMEDMLSPELYAALINDAFSLPEEYALDGARLLGEDACAERLVKKAEAYFKLLPAKTKEFDHYKPAFVLHSKQSYLRKKEMHISKALDRFEQLFEKLNVLLDSDI